MIHIPVDQITFEPASMVDNAGKVFWWKGEIYRAIQKEYASFYRDLLSSGNIPGLYEAGLVTAEMTELMIDDTYPLVLRHERVPHISYCMEWSSEMLRDAAGMMCNLSMKLFDLGLTIKDAHPWNVLFHAGRPVFIDWGSIVPVNDQSSWPYEEFRSWFLLPLYLMSAGRINLVHSLQLDVTAPPQYGDVLRLLFRRIPVKDELRFILADKKTRSMNTLTKSFFHELNSLIHSIPVASNHTEWTDYEGPDRYPFTPSNEWPVRIKNIHALMQETKPATLLDIGCNKGWYSKLANLQGIDVISVDLDESSINSLYRHAKESKSAILPLYMDFCRPTPPHGLGNAYADATARLRSEMVLALAVTHHLVFKRYLSFETIARQLSAFTVKWLIVEFVPSDDYHVSKWVNDQHSWYTLDNFVKALEKYYHQIEISESTPHPRKLLFCTK
jgi:hypothetical protein